MRAFLDTNIILDVLEHRQPHAANSHAVLERCELLSFPVYIAWHSISNIFYIYSRKVGAVIAQMAMKQLLQAVSVATVGDREAARAFSLNFADLEDALQVAAAEACEADFIITRNEAHFKSSPVAVLTPSEFLQRFPCP